ncbi:hypothetical protein OGAPHI_004668 [Ogataea philodendri]|uniref:Zn(2)-C6 fungal-type domain-containing protein n=2 Tax=Saccharomycotina TaxID=147537 RepID=A0A9P8P2M5_9ASCO|nr:uncharacterized protein OGAPHI_004668 [Ogataea philodendri]KAH3663954.1 hypothetical protein OGAPHI_004668 [Ogataea philodendri]
MTLGTSPNPRQGLSSHACLFCQRRKRKCDGGHPCETCIRFKNRDGCEYRLDSDHRKKKLDSTQMDYLEIKADLLHQLAISFENDDPRLDEALKLSSPPEEPSDMAQAQVTNEMFLNASALDDITSSYGRIERVDGTDSFYGPTSGRSLTPVLDVSNKGDVSLNDIFNQISNDRISQSLVQYLLDIFENTFLSYFPYSISQLLRLKSVELSEENKSERFLLCSILAYASAYSDEQKPLTSLFLKEAKKALLNGPDTADQNRLILGLMVLSSCQLGLSHDYEAWMLHGSCCSRVFATRFHSLPVSEKPQHSTEPYSSRGSGDSRKAVFWSIVLQDRLMATIFGRGSRIHYSRITTPFYTAPKPSENNISDYRYVGDLTFSFQSKMWYIYDRAIQQLYSSKSHYIHRSHKLSLLKAATTALKQLLQTFPDLIQIRLSTSDRRILLLHLSYYVVSIVLYRSFIETGKEVVNIMIRLSSSAVDIVDRFSTAHGFNRSPWWSGYLLFQCAILELFLLTLRDESLHEDAKTRFNKYLTALSEFADTWSRGLNNVQILGLLAERWNVRMTSLDELRKKSKGSFNPQLNDPSLNDLVQYDSLFLFASNEDFWRETDPLSDIPQPGSLDFGSERSSKENEFYQSLFGDLDLESTVSTESGTRND